MTSKFQKLMMTMFNQQGAFCMVFVDDIIVFSNSVEEHIAHLNTVLSVLTRWNMKIKPAKVQIGYKNLFALGHKVGADGVQVDRRKLINVEKWPTPTARTIEHFLGLFNYFRKFIPRYSVLMGPLERVRKNFEWTEEQARAWESAKKQLLEAPILHFPEWKQRFYLAVDGSLEGFSGVLFQFADPSDDEVWKLGQKLAIGRDEQARNVRIIAMKSRATKSHERKYSQNKCETAALVYALYQFYPYLYGKEFTVFTDHEALVWLFKKEELNRTVSGWIDVILEYKMEIVHVPGIKHVLPDILTRIYPVKNIRGEELQSSMPIQRRRQIEPTFLPVACRSAITVKSMNIMERYDLTALNEIQWARPSLVRPRKPKGKRALKKLMPPTELMTTLETIFGELHKPEKKKDRGLSKKWGQINFVHPMTTGESIERWLRKGLKESDQRGSTSVFLLPEWKKRKWFVL